jgi:uncharacterized repeat protein (TIGR03803 family)
MGTVFKVTPSGQLTTLYSFCSQSGCTDGSQPYAGLVQATDGNFYGTTFEGGASKTGCSGFGCGTVFKIAPSGTLTTLYNFCSLSSCTDGSGPLAGVIQGTDGNFYGTTFEGGTNTMSCNDNGCGTVFRITGSGTLTTLYSFCSQGSCTDGEYPEAGMVHGTDGNFYGTTAAGGADTTGCDDNGCGTVFSLSLSLAPTAKVSPSSLSFSGQDIGTTSPPKKVTLTNTSTNGATLNPPTLTFTGADPGDFAISSDGCTAPLAPGAHCIISVTFSPIGIGKRKATLTITDNASNSPQSVSLTGTGPDFSISASPSSVTVTRGQSVQSTLTLTPHNGFNQTIALTCSGGPRFSTCSITPSSVTLDGVHSQTATLTISTTSKTPKGTSKVTAKGTSGSDVHTVLVTVTVD